MNDLLQLAVNAHGGIDRWTANALDEERHHFVTDELVDHRVVPQERARRSDVEPVEQRSEVCRDDPLAKPGGSAHVGEQDRDVDLGSPTAPHTTTAGSGDTSQGDSVGLSPNPPDPGPWSSRATPLGSGESGSCTMGGHSTAASAGTASTSHGGGGCGWAVASGAPIRAATATNPAATICLVVFISLLGVLRDCDDYPREETNNPLARLEAAVMRFELRVNGYR